MNKETKNSNKTMGEDLKCDIPVVLTEHTIMTNLSTHNFYYSKSSASFSCTNLPSSGHIYQKI